MLSNIRVFNARFVNKIRNENTKKTYQKLRLIIKTYNNLKKIKFLCSTDNYHYFDQYYIIKQSIKMTNRK